MLWNLCNIHSISYIIIYFLYIITNDIIHTMAVPCMQGWEEQVDAAVTHLLRTTLSKSSKEQAVPPNSSLEMPAECQKLKKHIALLCDRICKGYMPSGHKIEVHDYYVHQK